MDKPTPKQIEDLKKRIASGDPSVRPYYADPSSAPKPKPKTTESKAKAKSTSKAKKK